LDPPVKPEDKVVKPGLEIAASAIGLLAITGIIDRNSEAFITSYSLL
jgi:hypothetical protein